MATAPKWIQNLTLDALCYWESKGNEVASVLLKVRRAKQPSTSGNCAYWVHEISLRLGTDRLDAKVVLLHEIAHDLAQAGHTSTFWDIAWELYRWAKLPIAYCKKREGSYRAGALQAYHRGLGHTRAAKVHRHSWQHFSPAKFNGRFLYQCRACKRYKWKAVSVEKDKSSTLKSELERR